MCYKEVAFIKADMHYGEPADEISFRPPESTFCIMEFSRFSQDLHVKNPRLLHMKISFNIYSVRSVDEAFCESLYLYIHYELGTHCLRGRETH